MSGVIYEKAVKEEHRMSKPGEPPAETQERPEGVGLQSIMKAQPISDKLESEVTHELEKYRPSKRLLGRKALITGGDSGIGRSIALFFAMEGADVAINYLPVEQKDAEDTRALIQKETTTAEGRDSGRMCKLIPLDLRSEENCKTLILSAIKKLGGLNILVNNAGYQMCCEKIEDLKAEQVEKTFQTNVFAPIYLVKYAVPHMPRGSSIIFSTSVVAYKGSKKLIDYSASKAAEVGLVRSLALQLAPKGIRVNGVAPGPVWTPLQPISRTEEDMDRFGKKKPLLGRIAQPSEMGPSYVFLASSDGAQFTGQVLHPNSGTIVGS